MAFWDPKNNNFHCIETFSFNCWFPSNIKNIRDAIIADHQPEMAFKVFVWMLSSFLWLPLFKKAPFVPLQKRNGLSWIYHSHLNGSAAFVYYLKRKMMRIRYCLREWTVKHTRSSADDDDEVDEKLTAVLINFVNNTKRKEKKKWER